MRANPSVPNHDGTDADPDQVFFGSQLDMITGPLRTATSTARKRGLWGRLVARLRGEPTRTCSYVGRSGVVVNTLKNGEVTSLGVRFSEADRLESTTDGATWLLTWYCGRRVIFRLQACLNGGPEPTESLAHLCCSALHAWDERRARKQSRRRRAA